MKKSKNASMDASVNNKEFEEMKISEQMQQGTSGEVALTTFNVADVNQLGNFNDGGAAAQVVAKAIEVNLFDCIKDNKPKLALFDRMIEMVRTDAEVKHKTEWHRQLLEMGEVENAKKVKEGMPNFGVAALFEGTRSGAHVKKMTGITMVDIDDEDPERIAEMLELIKCDEHTLAAHTTISGAGIHVYVRYETDPAPANITQAKRYYGEAFDAVNDYYKQLLGIEKTDGACRDLARVSFLSHDRNVYYNPAATPIVVKVQATNPVGRPPKKVAVKTRTIDEVAPIVLKDLSERGIEYKEGTFNKYVSRACYAMNKYGVSETECMEWATSTFTDYDPVEVESIIHSCYKHTEDHATKSLPTERKKRESSTATTMEIRSYLKAHYTMRYDSIKRRYEMYNDETEEWEELTLRKQNTIQQIIDKDLDKRVSTSDLRTVIESDYAVETNALREYLKSLPYDPNDETNYIAELAARIDVGDEKREFFKKYLTKWIVAMVAGWLGMGKGNEVTLVLVGDQGIGKSQYLEHLIPPALKEYFASIHLARVDKEFKLQTTENALIVLEELDAMDNKTLHAFKAASDATSVAERDVYAPRREKRPRITSFAATSNNLRFLTDNQNRRFIPIYTKSIVNPFNNPINYDKLYAQIYHMCMNGFQYWLDSNDMKEQAAHNRDFEVPNVVEELIEMHFLKPTGDNKGEFYNAASIISTISYGYAGREHFESKDITSAMDKLGFKACRVENKRGWKVIPLSADAIRANRKLDAQRCTPIDE